MQSKVVLQSHTFLSTMSVKLSGINPISANQIGGKLITKQRFKIKMNKIKEKIETTLSICCESRIKVVRIEDVVKNLKIGQMNGLL